MENYNACFNGIKASRKLEWLPMAGVVELEIKMGATCRTLKVTPAEASLILAFKEKGIKINKDEYEIEVLAQQFQVHQDTLLEWVEVWSAEGVLGVFSNRIVSINTVSGERLDELKSLGKKATSSNRQLSPEASNLAPMILAMLTNLGSCPLEMIHRTLSMLCMDPFPYTLNPKQLEQLLSMLVDEGKLEHDGVKYALKK